MFYQTSSIKPVSSKRVHQSMSAQHTGVGKADAAEAAYRGGEFSDLQPSGRARPEQDLRMQRILEFLTSKTP
jgi:hypothetical protein